MPMSRRRWSSIAASAAIILRRFQLWTIERTIRRIRPGRAMAGSGDAWA